jgi:hypothetical protein
MKDEKITQKTSRSESGAILPMVIILMLALMMTGMAFLNAGILENGLVRRQIHKEQSFYLAEAGVETAIWQFNYGDRPWRPWTAPWTDDDNGNPTRTETLYAPQDSSVGDYEVTVIDKDGPCPQIDSFGYAPSKEAEGKVEKKVCIILEKSHDPLFNYAIASAGGIVIENAGTVINGNCYTIGDISIISATVNGNAEATETVSVTDGGTVTGTITEGAEELPFPEFDSDYYQYKATSIISGDLMINGVTPYAVDGILYVTGNLTISNSTLVGPGSIVAEGKINVQQNSIVGTSIDTGVSLVSAYESAYEGDIAIKIEEGIADNPTIIWGALWSPNGEIKIEMNSKLYGSAVSGDRHKIETGSGVIDYRQFDEDFYSYAARPTYLVQNWQEE